MGFPEAQYAIDEVVDELKPTLTSVANVMMSRISIRCLVPGTAFKIEQTDGNDFTTTTKIVAKTDYKDANGVYWIHVPVPPGEYKITISKEDLITTATVSAKVAGQSYIFTYEVYKLIQTITSNTTFTLDDPSNTWPGVYVTALGGGGGGGRGGYGADENHGNGGGGGGRSTPVLLKYAELLSFAVTIGAGGAGAVADTSSIGSTYGSYTAGPISGTAGGATVISGVVTVPGGGAGGGGTPYKENVIGAGGTNGGGAGGRGSAYNSDGTSSSATNGNAGSAAAYMNIGGAGGAGGNAASGGGGGGGAGGYGAGGAGGAGAAAKSYNGSSGANGGIGAGGGGGGGGNYYRDNGGFGGAGGAGGAGIVFIYKGLVMK